MESSLQHRSQEVHVIFLADILDLGGGAATLYMLNSGMHPPNPVVQDVLYDFSAQTISVYCSNGWKNIVISQVCGIQRASSPLCCSLDAFQSGSGWQSEPIHLWISEQPLIQEKSRLLQWLREGTLLELS
ncbi:hypothetical protein JVT61DRAFT_15642 [Boletus reticuloceps]|uniref:Uncharacterized protein n=1 Tax=Boletus reticuloceps TaxID=495285 RepID=A0A8I2YC56_9AGAM|nr:hypothetical protein JVT61DRAFT_15642 [Boletus reticuloceps]